MPGRLKGAADELNKNKKASTYGDKLIKGKEALADEMGNVDKAEAEARSLVVFKASAAGGESGTVGRAGGRSGEPHGRGVCRAGRRHR